MDIDIDDVIEKMRLTFVMVETEAVFAVLASNPSMSWIALPVVSSITKNIIRYLFDISSKRAVINALFLNTIIRKPKEATAYVNAINRKDSLQDASDFEYERAELDEINAFNTFIRFTS